MFKITVIIATSNGRTDLLFDRALNSVYNQTFYDNVDVIIADDTDSIEPLENILNKKRINMAGKMPTRIIKNSRTKKHSGTGAWNTAALSCINFDNLEETHFIAFLDDDDSWDSNYLSKVADIINSCDDPNDIGLISCAINFINSNGVSSVLYPSEETLTLENVFIRNPHIQGSNLFINLKVFLSIGGFDESLKSTTDRDLMMRYIEFSNIRKNIKTFFIKEALVNYFYDDNLNRVTNNKEGKSQGLDLFYRKYDYLFDKKIKEKSLERAFKLFSYEPFKYIELQDYKIKKNNEDKNYNKFNLILGFICFDENNIKELLESFFCLNFNDYIKDFDICIVSSIDYKERFDFIINNYTNKCSINLKYLNDKKSISKNRTYLQNFIYDYGHNKYASDFVTWIIDDDCRFYSLYNNEKYYINYFYYISKYLNTDIDCLLGGNSGDIPLPFFSALRTQLLDLSYHIKTENYDNVCRDYVSLKNKEYYYDLSSKDFDFLEYPILNFYGTVEDNIKSLKQACIFTRQIEADIETIGSLGEKSIYRGCNTIIYNSELLKIDNFTPDDNSYNRRSDFNWAIINSVLLDRNIISINLPIMHVRYHDNFNLEHELKKIDNDLIGMIFYRVFKFMCEKIKYDNKEPSFYECLEYMNNELYKLKTKIFFNINRTHALNDIISSLLNDTLYYNQYKSFEFYIDKVLFLLKSFCENNKLSLNKEVYNSTLNKIYSYLY